MPTRHSGNWAKKASTSLRRSALTTITRPEASSRLEPTSSRCSPLGLGAALSIVIWWKLVERHRHQLANSSHSQTKTRASLVRGSHWSLSLLRALKALMRIENLTFFLRIISARGEFFFGWLGVTVRSRQMTTAFGAANNKVWKLERKFAKEAAKS